MALSAVRTSTGTLNKNSATPLTWSISVTRDSLTTVDIFSHFTGGGGNLDQQYIASNVSTANFTYTTAGLLFGGGSSVDQATFANVQFNVIPEPAGATLFVFGFVLLGLCRWCQIKVPKFNIW